jgi:hypothetical protein
MSDNSTMSAATETNPIAEAMQQACYGEIIPHLQAYQASQDPQQTLGLMEPYHFRRFAESAWRGMTSVATDVMNGIYRDPANQPIAHHPDFQQLQPGAQLQSEVGNRLAASADPFFGALGHLEQLLMGFRAKLQTAGERAENQGAGWGVLGAVIGG